MAEENIVSSADKIDRDLLYIAFGKSLMYIRKSRGHG
jgi:hypothetical protein